MRRECKAQLLYCGGDMVRKKLEDMVTRRLSDKADSLQYAISMGLPDNRADKPLLYRDDPRTRIRLGG